MSVDVKFSPNAFRNHSVFKEAGKVYKTLIKLGAIYNPKIHYCGTARSTYVFAFVAFIRTIGRKSTWEVYWNIFCFSALEKLFTVNYGPFYSFSDEKQVSSPISNNLTNGPGKIWSRGHCVVRAIGWVSLTPANEMLSYILHARITTETLCRSTCHSNLRLPAPHNFSSLAPDRIC